MSAVENIDYTSAINRVMDALQDAQETVVNAKAEIMAAPGIASSAKEIANEAKALAEAALPKTGGTLTGELAIDATSITLQKHNSVGFSTLRFTDKDSDGEEILCGDCQNVWGPTASFTRQLLKALAYKDDGSLAESTIEAVAFKDGTIYGAAPHPPANEYGKQIVTVKTLKDYTARKAKSSEIVHVGGDNASDTANLFEGRGSLELPFATFAGAAAWVAHNLAGGSNYLTFELHSDQVISILDMRFANIPGAILKSDSTKRKITVSDRLCLRQGALIIQDVELFSNNAHACVEVNGCELPAKLRIGADVVFGGTVSAGTVYSYNGGWITFNNQPSGSVTGKKYTCNARSVIHASPGVSLSSLPGSQAGVVDDTSAIIGG